MREQDVQCYRCPNECLTTMVISAEGLVTDAWRNVPAHNSFEKKSCKTLANVLGKNFAKASKFINSRTSSTRITIGH